MNNPKYDKRIIYDIPFKLKEDTVERMGILTNISRKYGFDGHLIVTELGDTGYEGVYNSEEGDIYINFSSFKKRYDNVDELEEKLILTTVHELGHATDLSKNMYMEEEKMLLEKLALKNENKRKIKKLRRKCEKRILRREKNAYSNGKKILKEFHKGMKELTGKIIENPETKKMIKKFKDENKESYSVYKKKIGTNLDKEINRFLNKIDKNFDYKESIEYKELVESNKMFVKKIKEFEKNKSKIIPTQKFKNYLKKFFIKNEKNITNTSINRSDIYNQNVIKNSKEKLKNNGQISDENKIKNKEKKLDLLSTKEGKREFKNTYKTNEKSDEIDLEI